MGFNDIIKRSILESFETGTLSVSSIITTIIIAMLIGIFIFFVYRFMLKSSFYNASFCKSLGVLPVITAGIMIAMQGNLVISLGMVGALSIVRFRNAVKDSIDLTFLFWSISMGIISGAGLFLLALLLSCSITVLLFGLNLIPSVRVPYLLVIVGDGTLDDTILISTVKKYCQRAKIKSRNVTKNGSEWIVELKVKREAELINDILKCDGIISVNLMTHEGELRV